VKVHSTLHDVAIDTTGKEWLTFAYMANTQKRNGMYEWFGY